jgi:hypothetical protein
MEGIDWPIYHGDFVLGKNEVFTFGVELDKKEYREYLKSGDTSELDKKFEELLEEYASDTPEEIITAIRNQPRDLHDEEVTI